MHQRIVPGKAETGNQIGFGRLEEAKSSHDSHIDNNCGNTDTDYDSDDESDFNDSEGLSGSDAEDFIRTNIQSPWQCMISQIYENNKDEYNTLVKGFVEDGNSKSAAKCKAHNMLLGKYRRSLREGLVDRMLHFRRMKKDPTYQKIMKTKRKLMDEDDYDEDEAIESAVKKRKFLINRLIQPMDISSKDSETGSDEDSNEESDEESNEESDEDSDKDDDENSEKM